MPPTDNERLCYLLGEILIELQSIRCELEQSRIDRREDIAQYGDARGGGPQSRTAYRWSLPDGSDK